MGFFSKKRGTKPHAGHNTPFNVRMMERAPYKGMVQLQPRLERHLYIYYPEYLADVQVGQEIMIEAFPGDVTMVSSYNGAVFDTGAEDAVPWMFRGNIIGDTRSCRDAVRLLLSDGYRVFARARHTGWYAPGVPEITAYFDFRHEDAREIRI